MVNKTTILQNLNRIDRLYKKHIGDTEANYYAKLAVLELCGWIEETMDDIIRSCAGKHLKEKTSLEYVEQLIENTHSFKYNNNFSNMLRQLVGLISLERLEKTFNTAKFQVMISSLATLKQIRDEYAHTYIKEQTNTIRAPSFTKNQFDYIYDGLKDVEHCIRICVTRK